MKSASYVYQLTDILMWGAVPIIALRIKNPRYRQALNDLKRPKSYLRHGKSLSGHVMPNPDRSRRRDQRVNRHSNKVAK